MVKLSHQLKPEANHLKSNAYLIINRQRLDAGDDATRNLNCLACYCRISWSRNARIKFQAANCISGGVFFHLELIDLYVIKKCKSFLTCLVSSSVSDIIKKRNVMKFDHETALRSNDSFSSLRTISWILSYYLFFSFCLRLFFYFS